MQVFLVKKTYRPDSPKEFFRLILFFLINLLHATPSAAQCVTTTMVTIPDNGALSIDFLVSGLVDNDLASPTQGVCGVEIDFRHEYLGDLKITLVSPSGQMIDLVGPVTTATTSTNLSRWNVSFVPCLSPAMPDAGFTNVWSNLQPWQVFTAYSGSYHPHAGCLEDFNTGPANGTWRIIFSDQADLQTGSVTSASLIFCNQSGLQCLECSPNGGIVNPSSVEICEGQTINTSDVTVDFGGNPPSPSLYSYTYFLSSGNTIITSGTSFSHMPAAGAYTLCGLSYLTTDVTAVNNVLATADNNQLSQAIANGVICAEKSSVCVTFIVVPKPDTTNIDVLLCKDEPFVFKGQLFPSPGIFFVSDGGICDSVFRLDINASTLNAVITGSDSISCGGAGVQLIGSSSGVSGPLMFEWSTESGVLSGDLNSNLVTAHTPGIYKLTIRDGICESSTEITVYGDSSYPQIFVEDGELTCVDNVVTLNPVVIPSNVTYLWSGPSGFSSSLKVIDVSVPGRYYLTVMSPEGCNVITYADVVSNTTPPDANIVLFDKSCEGGFGVLGVSQAGNIYEWSAPDVAPPPLQVIAASTGGLYAITVTDPNNGCTATGFYNYVVDYNIPAIDITGIDSIRCNQDLILSVDYTGINVIQWSGPNGFTSSAFDVNVLQPGMYTIYVFGANGCKNTTSIELFPASNYPAFTITNDTISCLNPTGIIGISVPGADVFNWPALSLPDAANPFVQVSVPGSYEVTAIDTNSGCAVKALALVVSDLLTPAYDFRADTITCNNAFATLAFIPIAGNVYTNVQWQFPDMTTVINNEIVINEPGDYLLSVTGANGCIGSSLVSAILDTLPPRFFLEADTLGCDKLAAITNIRVDSLAGILWTGPGGFTSSELNPVVMDTGVYVAQGFSDNGCITEVEVNVVGDFSPPVSLLSLEELTCLVPDAVFFASSTEEIISYEWKDQIGNIIGTGSSISVSAPGIYTLQLEGTNHCFSLDSIVLGAPAYPSVIVTADTFKCEIDTVLLVAGSDVMDPGFVWTDLDGDTLSMINRLTAMDIGPFIISVTAPNGCEVKDTIDVPVDSLTPVVVLDVLGEVRCQERDFVIDGSASTPATIEYNWSTIGGEILSDPTAATISARDTGLYILDIYNPSNECTDRDSVFVSEHPDAITLAYLDIKRPVCSGDSNAQIIITGLEGGVGPVYYELDSSGQQASAQFQGLNAGSFLLQISDAEGCLFDTLVTIDPTNLYTVNAGPDQEIYIGESTSLAGETDILPEDIFAMDWDSMGVIFCQDCLESLVSPWETTVYHLQVTSVTGCVVEDEVTIYVIEKGKFFIPNIFTPNGDNVNDEIRFYTSPGITKVLKWIVFDRWGNAVFGKTDFDPNDSSVYWNGSSQGSETLNPGVYPYVVELELVNGNKETHHGTITLVR